MKKIICLTIIITMIISMFTTINGEVNLTDVKSSDWFYSNVEEMIRLGMVKGFADNTFKPKNPVKADEFIKMIVIAMGYDAKPTTSTYWADGFIQRAEELKICDTTFINDYRFDLTREQASKIVANALSLKEMRPLDTYYDHIKPLVKDFYLIQDKYKEDVVDCYAWGIMQGDNKNLVNPQNNITRAEATTVILRMIDKTRRIVFKLDEVKSIEMETNEQTPGLLIAPKYNGVVLNEMVELVEAVKAVESETTGVEQYVLNKLGNSFSIAGYENQRKYDEVYNLNMRTKNGEINLDNIVEETEKIIYHQDWILKTSLIEFHNKRTPYDMVIYNRYSIADDNTCSSNYEYVMKYYKKTLQAMFKVWFEDEYDTAWNIFDKALKYTGTYVEGEEKIINNRNFFIHYSNKSVGFTVSVKLN